MVASAGAGLNRVLAAHPAIKTRLFKHIRRCGNFVQYDSLPDNVCLQAIWKEAADGINYCIRAYSENKGMRYAGIDSTHYATTSPYYQGLLHDVLVQLARGRPGHRLFFKPWADLAGQLLIINGRDESTRYDLTKLNANVYAKIPSIRWQSYPYSAIVVLGEGPEDEKVPLSPYSKYRCQTAAESYRMRNAPFIIVSGGHVHPFQTIYAEAIEMRRYLVQTLGIPASAVIVEPVARHTTTNLRNVNRILIRKGFPLERPALCVTSPKHVDYILDRQFGPRCLNELGYLPYRDLLRLDPFRFTYYPTPESLESDPMDPLDP